MNYFLLAWRNLWRNRRRTLITVSSIFFGVFFSTLMNSMQDGTYQNMIDMMVKLSTGYLQVQHPEFRNTRSVNDVFFPEYELVNSIKHIDGVSMVSKRLESFALLSSGPNTRGGAVIGIEPDDDKNTSNLSSWISDGRFLSDGDDGVLVTSHIAKHLQLGVNDTIILISQGYRGVTAAGVFPVRGILTFSTPQMNGIGVFMDVHAAQKLFHTDGMVSSLMIMVNEYTDVGLVKKSIEGKVTDQIVLDWTEMNPELVNFIESDKAGGVLMIGILYIVIGFGILGTVIMMVAERKKEMAVMVAVGMKKLKLGIVLLIETLLIGVTGVISGFIVSVPVILALVNNPVRLPENMAEAYLQYGFEPYMFFGAAPAVFLNQVMTIFFITMIIAVYPIMKIRHMVVSKSLKS